MSSAFKELLPPSVSESEDGIEGFPASSVVLGMKLGDHARKNSDGKSSMMGLSALGLESHRESLENLPELVVEEEQMIESTQLEVVIPKGTTFNDEDSVQGEGRADSEDVMKVVQFLVQNEIEDALSILQQLEHPGVAKTQSNS